MLDDVILREVTSDHYDHLEMDKQTLLTSLKRVTCQCLAVPVLLGSSLKNIGVEPLLDAIISFLPSPADKPLEM